MSEDEFKEDADYRIVDDKGEEYELVKNGTEPSPLKLRETNSKPSFDGSPKGRRCSLLRVNQNGSRRDHLMTIRIRSQLQLKTQKSKPSSRLLLDALGASSDTDDDIEDEEEDNELAHKIKNEMELEMDRREMSNALQHINSIFEEQGPDFPLHRLRYPLEVRVKHYSISVPIDEDLGEIKTVWNSSAIFPVVQFFKKLFRGQRPLETSESKCKKVLENISLVLKPGKSYLVLGPPRSGKSTLLKAISGLIRPSKTLVPEGEISYNGRTLADKKEFYIENAFSYIDQLDQHAPRLTCYETLLFASLCKAKGKLTLDYHLLNAKEQDIMKRLDREKVALKMILAGLGLSEVQDTFVGSTMVRGVSGGQRRRVTVGEMLMSQAPVLCGDEITTGLDASSAYDMIQLLVYLGKIMSLTRVISLLQPSPEALSLFDEIILLSEGRIVYAGPVDDVEDYFAEIGYMCPQFMDIADFLQMVSTKDGEFLYEPSPSIKEQRPDAPDAKELADIFRHSKLAKKMRVELKKPLEYVWDLHDKCSNHGSSKLSGISVSKLVESKYVNSFSQSLKLIISKFLVLWARDKRVIIAGAVKNVIMGVSVGGIYLSTTDEISIEGALFQAGLFIMLCAMQSSSSLLEDRVIFYKQTDANFYSAWPFMFGRAISQIPQITFDTITFATILYYMVGLGGRNEAGNFFTYLALLLVFSVLMTQQLALFAAFADSGTLSALSSCTVFLLILFGGFIVPPADIPRYYSWIYWWNPFAWIYRALIVNEFRSSRWPDQEGEDPNTILRDLDFLTPSGEPFGSEWIGYAFAYCLPYSALCVVLSAFVLSIYRNNGQSAARGKIPKADDVEVDRLSIPFKPVTISFRDICYEVTASTSSDTLYLLKNINGVFRSGSMTALMGSSGAGKTTLMDVIALRKHSGIVKGEVFLNGWAQDEVSFRRCSGYVEQFDTQSSQLTCRESVLFSAKLRLDYSCLPTDFDLQKFVDQVMNDVELLNLADELVGTDEGVGLSTEQKKRLSIAVELAASPSVLFLDEPTSGLDSRSAQIVVRALRKIADQGRTICATIHQPSFAVFDLFDDLLLLRKGGEVVYHGPLGDKDCEKLVHYFESNGAPKINIGENPANWVLRVMSSPEMKESAEVYRDSNNFAELMKELDRIQENRKEDDKIFFDQRYAVGFRARQNTVNNRLSTIYWRSPAYNYVRIIVSLVIAFILGSAFITDRHPAAFTENGMRARLSVVFLSFIIIGIMAMFAVIPVMTEIRDMYYRHNASGMYGSATLGVALGVAEKWFILLSSTIFCVIFLETSGIYNNETSPRVIFKSFVGFWGYFTFNFAIYSYFGQLFVCLVQSMKTVIILASVFIGINNFFSGLVARPQFMIGGFYVVPFYICPGHYVYNGMVTALYRGNYQVVTADQGTEFFNYTGCTVGQTDPCESTADNYITFFFGGVYGDKDAIWYNALPLGLFLIIARLSTWLALRYIRYG